MVFINLALLGFLGALALPLLIHLLRARYRFKPAALGTLRFVRQALQETSARRRVSVWLLLLLRLAMVAAAVLLFARPYRPGTATPSGTDWLVLLDASGSMNVRSAGSSHFELAARRARRLASGVGENQRVRVWLCAEEVRQASAAEVDSGCKGVVPAGQVDWPAVLRRAAAAMSSSTAADRRVLILTDRQRSDLPAPERADSLPRWPAPVAVEVQSLATCDRNVEVVDAQAANGSEVTVTVALHGGPPTVPLPLEVRVNGTRAGQTVVPPSAGLVRVSLPSTGAGEKMAEIHLDAGDCLPEDDRFWLPLSPPAPAPVWLVADTQPGSRYDSEAYFLEKALQVVPGAGEAVSFAPRLAQVKDGAVSPDLRGAHPVVVLCDCGAPEAAALPALAAAVKGGAGLLVFLGGRSAGGSCAEALVNAGLLPATPAPRPTEEQAAAWWDVSHPALGLFSLDRLDLASLRLVSRHDLAPAARAGARPLIKLEDESVAMVETRPGQGRVLVVAASPTRRDSDWVVQRAFAPLMREWARHAGGAGGQGGDWPLVNRRFTDRAGFGPDLPSRRILRFPGGEGDLVWADETQFRSALHLPARPTSISVASVAAPAGAARAGELWPWLALVFLGLASIETRVADRRRL